MGFTDMSIYGHIGHIVDVPLTAADGYGVDTSILHHRISLNPIIVLIEIPKLLPTKPDKGVTVDHFTTVQSY